MGRDKLALTVGGTPIIRRVYETLKDSCDEVIAVVSGEEATGALPEGVRRVRDLRPGGGGSGAGPLAGLETGLSEARYPLAFVVAGDMPFLTPQLVAGMLRRLRAGEAYAVVPRPGGRLQPLCAAYRRESLGYVCGALDEGVRAARDLVGRLPEVEELTDGELSPFGRPELLLMNVNSEEDLLRARRLAGEERCG